MAKTNVKKVKKYIKKLNLSQKYTELFLVFHKIRMGDSVIFWVVRAMILKILFMILFCG
jgi:hypothetical protein